ncbi:AAA family ATPase [Rhizobium grahamii]|uniref:AAA family ATPase n=1 Tax=Rhizobium grahamii TaxID=1120045 RepID=A0A5Q0C730_9HYPH|nr:MULTISPECIES: AAA family ATPase [Rhizobium]QFY59721.1 AAA family ATPase [Rhizobium grahamii]QRM51166.1 AAA family ATPase [Rhizobium sp. BG6]
MDKALADSLDRYIFKLQEVANQLKGSRSNEFRKANGNNAAIALKSATDFLAYCALVALFRRNIGALSEPSCVAVIAVPSHWQLSHVDDAAKIILKDIKGVRVCLHPTSKHRRGWEIDAAEILESGEKLIIFAQEGSVLHEDFELTATLYDRLAVCDVRHLRALCVFRRCGKLTDEEAAVIGEQASERMEAIFRRDQPASRAAAKLLEAARIGSANERRLDVTKGFGEASVWADALKRDLKDWRQGKLPWAEVDKGCLLYGPPGTGKTRFAAALAAHCGLHLEATSIPKWQAFKDGDLGDMLKAMYQAFNAAKENAPCLLFLDEFDAIGDRAKFPSRHETYSTTVVNALLECLDGTEGREGVIVLGACNYPEKIDPALLRSGRLEKHVRFPLPDATARGEILEFHLPNLAGDAALKEIGARLPGKSGADLERLAREARRIARKESRDVNISDVRSLVEVPTPLDAKTLYRVAIHEAGHAIVTRALLLGKVERVEIYDNVESFATTVDANGGTFIQSPSRAFLTRWDAMKMITADLAGAAAEDLIFGHRSNWSTGNRGSDFAKATMLAIRMVTEYAFGNSLFYLPESVDITSSPKLWEDLALRDDVTEILGEQYQRARDMLDGLKPALLKLADALVKHKRLDAPQLEPYWPGSRKVPSSTTQSRNRRQH